MKGEDRRGFDISDVLYLLMPDRFAQGNDHSQPVGGMNSYKEDRSQPSLRHGGDSNTTIAQHWYIRHGGRDRDTAFPVPINFATRLQNAGKNVNFLLAWNRPHSGDYALDELFEWIAGIVK